MARRIKERTPTGQPGRVGLPLNPSVRGTLNESDREEKGSIHVPTHKRSEGSGHKGGGGRGGKSSRGAR